MQLRRYDRDYESVLRGDPCSYCGSPCEHVDHIVPVVDGGTGCWENLTAACERCNKEKHRHSLLHFLRLRSDTGHRPMPMTGVRWRRDIQKWEARIHAAGRTFLLGLHETAAAACAAVDRWRRANPNAVSPCKAVQQSRDQQIARLWREGLTHREIGERMGLSTKAVIDFVGRARKRGVTLPHRGRGGPGARRGLRR